MIDSIANLLFRCSHQRITRPITPVSKGGDRSAETYVVCLDCGKQFSYDLTEMRIVKPIAVSESAGVLQVESKKPNKKLRYAAIAAALPLTAWLVGKSLKKPKKPSAD
jgi:hypothetical protein